MRFSYRQVSSKIQQNTFVSSPVNQTKSCLPRLCNLELGLIIVGNTRDKMSCVYTSNIKCGADVTTKDKQLLCCYLARLRNPIARAQTRHLAGLMYCGQIPLHCVINLFSTFPLIPERKLLHARTLPAIGHVQLCAAFHMWSAVADTSQRLT